MRTLGLLLFCLSAFAGQQTPAPDSKPTAQTNEQHARVVVNQMIQALGGQTYLALRDYQSEGRYGRYYHGATSGGARYFLFWRWPDSERWELTRKRDVIQFYLGDKAYETTFRGTLQLDPKKEDPVRQHLILNHYKLEVVLRQWLDAPGTALFYEGQGLTENQMTDKVTIMNAKDEAVTLMVATDTHLPVKKTFLVRDPASRERDEISELYDNWKIIQGINTPRHTQVLMNGEMIRDQNMDEITYNQNLQDSLFTPVMGYDIKKK